MNSIESPETMNEATKEGEIASPPQPPSEEVSLVPLGEAELKGKTPVIMREVNEIADQPIKKRTIPEYVQAFKANCRKSALASLELGRVVHEARETLSNDEFDEFIKEVGFNSAQGTISKLCCIGRMYKRFKPHIDKLPANWTSLYLITQIPAEYFDNVISTGNSFEDVTGNQLKELIRQTTNLPALTFNTERRATRLTPIATIKANGIDDIDYLAIRRALYEISARLPVRIDFNKQMEDRWNDRKVRRYKAVKKRVPDIEFRADEWDFGREANDTGTRSSIEKAVPAGAETNDNSK